MFSEVCLALWSGTGLAWWLISCRLVEADPAGQAKMEIPTVNDERLLSIFKPLPLLGPADVTRLSTGLVSFISQLDRHCEVLLGIHEDDRAATEEFLERLRGDYPAARLTVVFRSGQDEFPNPKIAWQKVLAPHARGELWLWSDADITAPADFLCRAREEFGTGGGLLTFPYVVRERAGAWSLPDALFVNAEFHPGVLLLRKFGPVDFALGAGMLFRPQDFFREVKWDDIGSSLADDFVLGQRLGPVRLSAITLSTAADTSTSHDAFLHYFRWSKTIRWNRPLGFAARLFVLPLAGWITAVILHPGAAWAWLGLLVLMQMDVFFAAVLCRKVGCRIKFRDWPIMEAWSIGRIIVWALCWLPVPVIWRGRFWSGPRAASDKA